MTKDIERLNNETQWDYLKRLTLNRTNYDLDYAEWAKLACGYECSSDNARKINYGVKSLIELIDTERENIAIENSDIEEMIFELERKKIELKKERVKLSTLRNELNKNVLHESRKELFYEELLKVARENSLEVPIYEYNVDTTQDIEYLQLFADVHYGSTFDIGINQYSPSICESRFNQMYLETVALIKKENITKFNVASQGDLVQGILRLTDIKLNSISMVEQVFGIARIVANYLNKLSQYVDVTYYHTINANHSELRLLGTKSGELQEDVELLIGNYIKDLLYNNERVKVVIANESVLDIELNGYNIGILHGQNIKNKETFWRDMCATRHKTYDYLLFGHIHHLVCQTVGIGSTGNNAQIISTPSMVGACVYSQKIMKTSPAGFLVLGFEKNKGKTKMLEYTLK